MSSNAPSRPDASSAAEPRRSPTYRWLRLLKVALGVVASLLTIVKLLGLL